MNKNAIKKYAIWARRELIDRVTQRAMKYGITEENAQHLTQSSYDQRVVNGTVLSPVEVKQRNALLTHIQTRGFQQVIEEAAYTWFNRFAALRFMEVNGYLPSHVRVFTNDKGEFKPQILAEAIHLDLAGLDKKIVYKLEHDSNGDELFKYLLIVQCNALNAILPGMFQEIKDYTELLFPDNQLREGSVIEQMITTIPEEDWTDQVQIIGWLYQYYISEQKDKVFADLKKNIKISKDNIPAATQLFTPDWIVHYMVENSLGRLWVEGKIDKNEQSSGWTEEERQAEEKRLAESMGWKYYLPEAAQEPEVRSALRIQNAERQTDPAQIRCIDPCMGSGHILCVLFDVLIQIYEDYGYTARESAALIVENNLWGLDIDERATQLAYFTVMMKARQYDRRFFTRNVQPHVYSPKGYPDGLEYGSLITVEELEPRPSLENWSVLDGDYNDAVNRWNFRHTLSQRYDIVVTNPPYMGGSGMDEKLSKFVKAEYPDSKSDMSTTFMEQSILFCNENGYVAMINIPVWMFLTSYEKLRGKLLHQTTISSMVHPGRGIFGSDFGITTYVLMKSYIPNYSGNYRRLFDTQVEVKSPEQREAQFLEGKGQYIAKQDEFSKIPGSPVAYWMSKKLLRVFIENDTLGSVAKPRIGQNTGDNNRFLRYWYEVCNSKITLGLSHDSLTTAKYKWLPYNKGGEYRRWYGNQEYVVNWENDGAEIKEYAIIRNHGKHWSRYIQNIENMCKPGITWSFVTSGSFSVRYLPSGFICDVAGSAIFPEENLLLELTALCNSVIATVVLQMLNPTINMQASNVASIPLNPLVIGNNKIITLTKNCISHSRSDWDSFETSWDFARHPFIRNLPTIKEAYKQWAEECDQRFRQLKANEEELNRIFIDIYGLQGELTPEVEDKYVTVRKADLQREVRSFISYAVSCMFGRYSLDVPGLAYAGGDWDASKYKTFQPDNDNIIPICDDEYFEDDIVGRFVKFVETVFGKKTLEENLSFIASALRSSASSLLPRQVLRSYFVNDFYEDHIKIYQKRPIYWQFDSGKKNGFKCLIYMHRYKPDVIARIRTDYIHEQQSRYRAILANLESRLNNASPSERVKLSKQMAQVKAQAEELRLYEEKIHHLADQMITIDLDDGVKANYAKFADVLAKIK